MIINYATIYIRLSLEDDDIVCGKLESESITNQRNLLHDYIQNSPELCHAEVIEFCDDGYSGKNFDRPGVKKLLEAARSGAIQCILVKDLSRFGRDYITVGNYVSRVFPFLGIHRYPCHTKCLHIPVDGPCGNLKPPGKLPSRDSSFIHQYVDHT